MNNFRHINRSNHGRSGVTIVEVLTSIIVAVIGVAGVLILIPFGIRQAQTGLDLQESTTVAENALAQFQITGYGRIGRFNGEQALPWINMVPERLDPGLSPEAGEELLELVGMEYDTTDPVGYYFIDPLWTSFQTDTTSNPVSYPDQGTLESMFVYASAEACGSSSEEIAFYEGIDTYGQVPFFPRYAHLLNPANPFSAVDSAGAIAEPPVTNPTPFALAHQMFVSRDNIQFASEIDPNSSTEIGDSSPPVPSVSYTHLTLPTKA